MKSLLACIAVLALGGCAATMGDARPFATPEGPARGYATAPAAMSGTYGPGAYGPGAGVAASDGGGSIFAASGGGNRGMHLFQDSKARGVGDLLTIVLVENTRARTNARTAVVGFCWGGSVAYLANARLGLPAVSYYGARTVPFLGEPLRAPMQFHFGARDHSIPQADIEAHRRARPDAELHVYDAGHGFARTGSGDYDAASDKLAFERTLELFETS